MEYSGKTIVAWLTYNENYTGEDTNKVLYVYPRYVKGNKGSKQIFEPIPEESSNDRIAIYGQDAPEAYANYGPLVKVKFYDEPKLSSKNLEVKSVNEEPKMSLKNLGGQIFFTALSSMVEIEKFYEQIMQTLDITEDFRTISANRYIEYPASQLFSSDLIIGTTDSAYYGPFEAASPDGKKIMLSSKKQYHYFIRKYAASEIDRLSMPIHDDKKNIQAVFIQKHLFQKHEPLPQDDIPNRIDWISDEELTNKLKSILKTFDDPGRKYTKKEIKNISDAIQSAAALNGDVDLIKERYDTLNDMLSIIGRQESFVEQLFPRLMQNAEFFDNLVTLLQEDDFKKIEERNAAFLRVRERLGALESEKETVKKEIGKLKENEKELEADIERLKAMEIQLRDVIARHLAEFSSIEKTIVRGIDARWLNRIFDDSHGARETREEDAGGAAFDIRLLVKSDRSSGNAIIERMSDYIRSAHRDISRNDVVNYLTCITQGFITTFAGDPGTGKTSLCTLLAKALGLARADSNSRFIDISVERGWTSHKDFIGYYNPLTKQMEKSNNEVFNAFTRLDAECGQPVDAPFLILLDEANLSPIEHYWAAFLKLCDPDSPHNRSLVLGGNHFLKIPEHLRFLATVNFDHTTEELSPRFLDRSWIITLRPTGITFAAQTSHESANLESIVPFSALHAAFLPKNESPGNDPSTLKCHEKWEAVQQTFQKNNLPIMPRNQKMVRSYYTVACRYMERDEHWAVPLDYAVAQKILPGINGAGKHYHALLTELKESCKMMPLCDYHLGRILQAADENMGFYQFFAK
ncbi:MAG: AAA family ATPase [Spirochaetaceae bacterium]|jgi:adenylate kinase family enzyme|nr:AAA family ATPase [Spirochaetaceae bacterium]